MSKVTKIIVILLALVVGNVVWEIKYDSGTNFAFYVAYKHAQKDLFGGEKFTRGMWGRGCDIIFEYNTRAPDEGDRMDRFENYLEKTVPCKERGSSAIIVRKSGDTYQIFIPYKKGSDTDPEIVRASKVVANTLSANVFDAQPVDIHMCDDFFNTNRVVSSQRRVQ